MYTLIGTPKSRAFRVLWMLHELGADFDHRPDPPHSDEVRRLNPSGKVPVLLTEGAALTDSTAILTYLADRHGAYTASPGTVARARQDGLMQFVLDEMDACIWTAARHSFVLPEAQRVPAIKDSLKGEFTVALARLSDKLGDAPYLTGESFTIADIVAGHCLGWAKLAKFPEGDGRLAAYLDRLRARPAYRAAQGV